MRRIQITLIFAVIFFNSACIQINLNNDEEFRRLSEWMTGLFDSKIQAAADSKFFDIRLEMVPIWNFQDDVSWLYVEQATGWSLDKPYRQRIYRVKRIDGKTFESAVFTLHNPLQYAGAWKNPEIIDTLSHKDLVEREGCAIYLTWDGEAFVGSTVEKERVSNLRGAAYATSEVRISENILSSWHRGFDENDVQVWRAVTEAYQFRKSVTKK